VITVPVQASGPAGRYTLTYRVVSGDGDAVTGTVAFTLTAAAAPATSTTTAAPATTTADPPSTVDSAGAGDASGGDSADRADSDGGVPVLVWIIGAAVVLVAGAVVALRAGRGRRS
jgi:copper resistance protein C